MKCWNSRQVAEELYSLQAKCHLSFREPQALKTHKPSADLSKKQSVSICYIQFRSGMGTRSWILSYSTIAWKFLLKCFQSFGHTKGLLAICLWKSHMDRTIGDTRKPLSSKGSRVEVWNSRHNMWKALQEKEGDGEGPGTESPWCECPKREAAESFKGSQPGFWNPHITFSPQILATYAQDCYLELQRGRTESR